LISEAEDDLAALRAWHRDLRATRLKAEAADAARRKAEAEELARARAERARAAAALQRGTRSKYSLRNPVHSFFDETHRSSDTCIALGVSGSSSAAIVLTENLDWYWTGLSRELGKVMEGRGKHQPRPDYFQLSCSGDWVVKFDDGSIKWSVPSAFSKACNEEIDRGKELLFCSFGASGSFYMQFTDGSKRWRGLSDRHGAKIHSRDIYSLSLGPQNQMFIRYEDPCSKPYAWVDAPKDAMGAVDRLIDKGYDVRQVLFGGADGDEYLIRYSDA